MAPETIKVVPLTCHGHSRPVTHLSFSAVTDDDQYYIISACKDNNPMLRDGITGDWIGTFVGHKGAVWQARLSSDATLAATASADFTAKVWDTHTGEALHTLQHNHIVRAVAFPPQKSPQFIATGGAEKKFRIFDLSRTTALTTSASSSSSSSPSTANPLANGVLNGSSHSAALPPPSYEIGVNVHQGTIKSILWTPDDANILITAADDKKIRWWDLRTRNVIAEHTVDGLIGSCELNTLPPVDGSLSNPGDAILSVAAGNSVYFFSGSGVDNGSGNGPGRLHKTFKLPHEVASVALNMHERKFVVGSSTDTWVHVYDFDSGEELEFGKGHHGPIWSTSFSPDGRLYATGSEDGTIKLWKFASGAYGLWRLTESKFPQWNDGDVIIWLSPSHQYQLHAAILRERSDYFRSLLVEGTALMLKRSPCNSELSMMWSLELVLQEDERDNEIVGHFQLCDVDSKERLISGSRQMADHADTKALSSLYQHYDNIFRAYYDKPLVLQDDSMPLIVQDITGLVHVAERLGSTRVVAPSAANAIIKQGQILFRSIAAGPLLWADLGIRIESDLIFKEGIIHLVGQWPRIKDEIPLQKYEHIRQICQTKHEQLEKIKQAIELRILGYYPTKIQRKDAPSINPAATGRGNGARGGGTRTVHTRMQSYAADIFLWMALNLFRHWMGQAICNNQTRNSKDGGFQFYKAIAAADRTSYIDKDDIDAFCNRFPLSSKGRSAFEDRILRLKEAVSKYVDDLIVNNSQLDINQWPVDYLTCCCVQKSDLPWLQKKPND